MPVLLDLIRFEVGWIEREIDFEAIDIVAIQRLFDEGKTLSANFGVDLGGFKKTPQGQAAQDAIAQAARERRWVDVAE